jgi:integrase
MDVSQIGCFELFRGGAEMPRANSGPRLVTIRQKGWTVARFYIRWTERGQTQKHGTGISASDPDEAQAYFRNWLSERARAQRNGPGDPDQVRIADVIEDYVLEHGGNVAAAETLAVAARPLLYFFRSDTIATMTPTRVHEFWDWRRGHSIKIIDTETGAVEVVERPIADGTIIRELGGTLRPAIQHAIKQRRLVPGVYYVPVPSAPPGRDYWITRSEAARLLWETRRDKRARLHLPLYAIVALYTGQRRGAILDLTWPQIDLVSGIADFNPRGRVQTAKRRPIIPVPRPLLAALRRAHRRASSEFVIAYRGEQVRDVKTGFNSAAERAGIPDCVRATRCGTQRGPGWRNAASRCGRLQDISVIRSSARPNCTLTTTQRSWPRPVALSSGGELDVLGTYRAHAHQSTPVYNSQSLEKYGAAGKD